MMNDNGQRKKENMFVVGQNSGDTKHIWRKKHLQQRMSDNAGNHADTFIVPKLNNDKDRGHYLTPFFFISSNPMNRKCFRCSFFGGLVLGLLILMMGVGSADSQTLQVCGGDEQTIIVCPVAIDEQTGNPYQSLKKDVGEPITFGVGIDEIDKDSLLLFVLILLGILFLLYLLILFLIHRKNYKQIYGGGNE